MRIQFSIFDFHFPNYLPLHIFQTRIKTRDSRVGNAQHCPLGGGERKSKLVLDKLGGASPSLNMKGALL